jgi:hypothetical protein
MHEKFSEFELRTRRLQVLCYRETKRFWQNEPKKLKLFKPSL